MWPLYPISDTIIGITIMSDSVSCSWIQKKATLYYLNAYMYQPLSDYEIIGPAIFNASHLKKSILSFLNNHKLNNSYTVFAYQFVSDSQAQRYILQYQLLALSLPLHCIMITSCATAQQTARDTSYCLPLSSSFAILEKNDMLQHIGLYMLGQKIYENRY